ncbi:MAG: hypothetical protein HWE09_14470 [Cyclobacteriaceae bacterium]|nr:hypothetical protein [Cyclobacteriaceae bacterium]
MFHLKEIKDNILSFERDHDLSDWKYQGMDIWPILRSLVFVECRNELNSRQNAVKLDWLRKSKRKRVRSFLRKLKVKLAFRDKDLGKTEKSVSKSLKADPTPAHAMFFGSWYFRTTFKGRFINKFFFPLTQIIENKFHLRSIEVEYSTGNKFRSEYKQISDEIEFIDAYEPGSYDESRIKWLKNDSRFTDFFDSLSKLGVPKDMADIMAHKIEKIYRESFRFEQLFSKYQPKMAFCLTFFNEQMFAMLFAASKADVKSIDVGHGFPSDPENLIYNRFGDYPKEGYNTFPDFFWVWDEPVKEAMNQWVQGQDRHQILVGGNPWLDFIIPTLSQESLSPKKVILYTLTVNRPEHFILDAMKKSQDRFEWWVRLHPAISLAKEEVREMFEKNGLTNFNLDEANQLQLPFLLKNCDVHISRNSSSIFESISMGNTPILIDEESINYYSSYIKKDLVKLLPQENDQSLLLAIEQVMNKPKGKNQSSSKSLEALSFLFENFPSELPLKAL